MKLTSITNTTCLLIASFLAISALLIVNQRKFIYHPQRYATPPYDTKSLQTISYTLNNHQQQAYFWCTTPKPKKVWVILSGNAALALQWLPFIKEIKATDTGFYLIDYPGYGVNGGTPTQKNNREGVLFAIEALTKQQPTVKHIFLLGQSLGAAVAIDVANTIKPQAMILISPFTSLADMSQVVFGQTWTWLLQSFLLDPYNSQDTLSELRHNHPHMHVTIIHGDRDQVVPVQMGRQLAQENHSWINYEEIRNEGHDLGLQSMRKVQSIIEKLSSESPQVQ